MHTRATFVEAFPEFAEVDAAVVDAKIAEASRRIDATVWGDWENDGHGQLTAHLLSFSVLGNAAKLEAKQGAPRTTYEAEYLRLRGMVGCALRST